MKPIFLTLLFFLTGLNALLAQSAPENYLTLKPEHHTHIFGNLEGIKIQVNRGVPWYVFADRADCPVYATSAGNEIRKRVEMGKAFLALKRSGKRIEVIEAERIKTSERDSTFIIQAGVPPLRGWIEEGTLLLSQRCMKVFNVGIPSAPKGLFNVQGLYVSNPAGGNTNFKFFSNSPGTPPGPPGLPIGLGGFGFIYKTELIAGNTWYLIGRKPDIPYRSTERILMGWKPSSHVELWKHRLALEYNWENAGERKSGNERLAVLQNPHQPSITPESFRNAPFVEKEFCYQPNVPDQRYYFQRALGSGFRHVLIEENENTLKVGVIKNSRNVPNKITDIAILIANDIMRKLLQPKVVFLLDGTESLERQSENIYNTITETARQIATENAGKAIQYSFGAAVYRDQGYDSYIYEKLPNLSGATDVVNWYRQNLKVRIPERGIYKNKSDKDYPEAVYSGLNETFKYFNSIGSFFNPTFFVLIGDCGNKDEANPPGFTVSNIKDSLRLNVSDLVAIQFEHKVTTTWNDNGRSWDLFPKQFREIFSVYRDTTVRRILGGFQLISRNRPGSFLCFPDRNSAFQPDYLSSLIRDALLKYNTTLQEKLVHLVLMMRDPSSSGLARRELDELSRTYISKYDFSEIEKEQVLEWAVTYLANAASNVNISSGQTVRIEDTKFEFFTPGYVSTSYNFLTHLPYKPVVYLSEQEIEKISDIYMRIISIRGNTRYQIQEAWRYMLKTSMGLFADDLGVDTLSLSEATSILTGFRGNKKYDGIEIGKILLPAVMPDNLLLEYIIECGISYWYLQGVKNKRWEPSASSLRGMDFPINAFLRMKGRPNINQTQLNELAAKLVRKDVQKQDDYFRYYPYRDIDQTYKLKAYWIESDFFSHDASDFINILLSVCPPIKK